MSKTEHCSSCVKFPRQQELLRYRNRAGARGPGLLQETRGEGRPAGQSGGPHTCSHSHTHTHSRTHCCQPGELALRTAGRGCLHAILWDLAVQNQEQPAGLWGFGSLGEGCWNRLQSRGSSCPGGKTEACGKGHGQCPPRLARRSRWGYAGQGTQTTDRRTQAHRLW